MAENLVGSFAADGSATHFDDWFDERACSAANA
ncbi:hypothetical protein J2805_000571 [Arthrobacter oryzae]|nr:hypothetical protein [Arthrobacter oryzae]